MANASSRARRAHPRRPWPRFPSASGLQCPIATLESSVNGGGIMAEGDKLPTIWQALSDWLGVELPTISTPLPRTRKNFDKALSTVLLALGENVAARLRRSTATVEGATEQSRAVGQIILKSMFRSDEERRKVENRALIVKAAQDDLQSSQPETDAPSEIDDDWLNFFARLAEDKSSEELQQLFGKILSGEVRRPGSFSLRTLQIMATISKADAERVSRLLSYALAAALDAMFMPFQERPEHVDRLFLEELGLAGGPSGSDLTWDMHPGARLVMRASTLAIVIINNSQKEITVNVQGQ